MHTQKNSLYTQKSPIHTQQSPIYIPKSPNIFRGTHDLFPHMNESCHTNEYITSHIWTHHSKEWHNSCSRIWISHFTWVNTSCHRYKHAHHVLPKNWHTTQEWWDKKAIYFWKYNEWCVRSCFNFTSHIRTCAPCHANRKSTHHSCYTHRARCMMQWLQRQTQLQPHAWQQKTQSVPSRSQVRPLNIKSEVIWLYIGLFWVHIRLFFFETLRALLSVLKRFWAVVSHQKWITRICTKRHIDLFEYL